MASCGYAVAPVAEVVLGASVAADVRAGDQLGITGTPASFVNGRFINGAMEESGLKELIEDELRRADSKTVK